MELKPNSNVLTDKGKEEFKNKYFTEGGYKTLLNYVQNLSKLYHKKPNYPYNIGIVLGIPFFKYSSIVENEKCLFERIKSYCQILGLKEIEIEFDNGSKITFGFNEGEINDT